VLSAARAESATRFATCGLVPSGPRCPSGTERARDRIPQERTARSCGNCPRGRRAEARAMIATGVSELAPVVGTSAACAALAVSRATSRRGARTPPLGALIARSELRVSAKGPPMNGSVTSGQLNDRHRGGASSTRSGTCSSLLSRKPTGRSVRAHRASDRHPDARSDARSNAWVRGAGTVLTTRPLPFQVALRQPCQDARPFVGSVVGSVVRTRPTNGTPDQIARIATGTMLAYAAASTTSDHWRLSCQRVSYAHPLPTAN
jgi:hypothetical protein